MRRLHRRLFLSRQRLTKKGAKLLDVDLDEVFMSSTNQTPSILKIAQENQPLISRHRFALRKGDLVKPICLITLENVGIRKEWLGY